jgi:isoquinoline 1-oxidoreductase subunit beta
LKIAHPQLDRRTLLIGGGVGVGLIVAYAMWPGGLASDLPLRPGEQAFGAFLKIGSDGRVTVAVPQVETGQGVWTALPQIVADELGASWESVAVEPAPLVSGYGNSVAAEEGWLDGIGRLRRYRLGEASRITVGSTSVRAFAQPLREAGAVARSMLIAAASERWNVDASECDTADGFVIHRNDALSFGELAEEAAGKSPPSTPQLRAGGRNRLVGKPLQRLDAPAKSDGTWRFAGDVRLPGMLFASAILAPTSGRLTALSREAVRRVPGARELIVRNDWVAAAGDSWWAADRAMRAANPHFSGQGRIDGAELRKRFEAALDSGDADRWFSQGDYDSAVEGARPLAATYWAGPAQHFGLEPLTATARFQGDRLELWAPTQAPELARHRAAEVAGISASDVSLYPMPIGDQGGRALEADAIPIAVELARALKRPVQLTLSHDRSQNQGRLSPPVLARMMALPGAGGITAAWKMHVATSDGLGSAIARLGAGEPSSGPGPSALDGAAPPYGIVNIAVDKVAVDLPFAAGYMRGHPQSAFTFFTESFLDELARAAGIEPLAFRMSLLGSNPRLANCFQRAAALGGRAGGGAGSTLGLAGCAAFGSQIALVAEATVGPDQRVEVHRLVVAVDCGRIINPSIVRQQIEGGLVWALGQAVQPDAEFVGGMPLARSLGSLGLPRMAKLPRIEIELIASNAAPGGVSGLGAAVLAPAVANAIYAGSGKRLRSLPFDVDAA